MRQATGGAPFLTEDAAKDQLFKANEPYAQVGIRLVATYQTVDPPAGVDLSNGFDAYTLENGIIRMTAENEALLGKAELRTVAADSVELYYVNYISHPQLVFRGIAYIKSQVPDKKYADSVVISNDNRSVFTVAHEIGHILLDKGEHYVGAQRPVNLMRSGTNDTDSHNASKRLDANQETTMLSKRLNLLTNP